MSVWGRVSRAMWLSTRTAIEGLGFVLSGRSILAVREARDRSAAVAERLGQRIDEVVERLDRLNVRMEGGSQRIDEVVERLDRLNVRMEGGSQRIDEVVERLGQLNLRMESGSERIDGAVERLDRLNVRMEGGSQRIDQIVSRIDTVTGDALPLLHDELVFFGDWLREVSYRLEQLRRAGGADRVSEHVVTVESIPRILATLEARLPALRAAVRVDFTSDPVPDADLISAARKHLGNRLATRLTGEGSPWDAWLHLAPGQRGRRPRLLAEAVERLRVDGLFVLVLPAPAEDLGGHQQLRLLPLVDLTGVAATPLMAAVWQRM
jgi:archaellum component FlaC